VQAGSAATATAHKYLSAAASVDQHACTTILNVSTVANIGKTYASIFNITLICYSDNFALIVHYWRYLWLDHNGVITFIRIPVFLMLIILLSHQFMPYFETKYLYFIQL